MNTKELDTLTHSAITTEHLNRRAIIYLRQSSPETAGSRALHQNEGQSTRAHGWPEHLIEAIDEDVGKGGFSVDGRTGWQRILAEIATNSVGITFATSVSRLTRQPSGYEQLRRLAADHGTLFCIGNRLIDPSDRLWRDNQ